MKIPRFAISTAAAALLAGCCSTSSEPAAPAEAAPSANAIRNYSEKDVARFKENLPRCLEPALRQFAGKGAVLDVESDDKGAFRRAEITSGNAADERIVVTPEEGNRFRWTTFHGKNRVVEQHFDQGGLLDGEFVSYHPNGIVKLRATARDGKFFGPARNYDSDGKLLSEVIYGDDGKAIKKDAAQ